MNQHKQPASETRRTMSSSAPQEDHTTKLRALLHALRVGEVDVDHVLGELTDLPFADLGYATVDHHRVLRQGVPEVIFGEGKTVEQVVGIARELLRKGQNVLATRIDAVKAETILQQMEGARYVHVARVVTIEPFPITTRPVGAVVLVCAGTADLPVAEECAESLRMFGIPFERLYDVGVAGLHRLLAKRAIFDGAALAIVVAGMEGVLPSVVGGLVSIPVIAVPTSVGYGVGAGGFAALLGMLTSCAAGVTVCNIDNGFGAAYAALRILNSVAAFETEHKFATGAEQ